MANPSSLSRLATLLDSVERAHPTGRLRRLWSEAVGPRVAARSEAIWLANQLLTVRVASPVWAQELSLLSDSILPVLQAQGLDVQRLRFRVAEKWERPAPPAPSPPRPTPAPEKPSALPEALSAQIASIEDDELRQAIAGAAAWNLTRNPKLNPHGTSEEASPQANRAHPGELAKRFPV